METIKKIGKALLFPHMAIRILLIPIATVFLIYSMAVLGTETVPAYIAYVLAAYTLTIWCMQIPRIIVFVKTCKKENKYAVRLSEDVRLRVNISLGASLVWNIAYSLFQLWLGMTTASVWYDSMAAYYFLLALMRWFMFGHTRKHLPGENMKAELRKYRFCGWVFLLMNVTVALMIFFMIVKDRTFEHDPITTIALAAYTFTAFTVAIVNIIRYRRYESPVYSASKAISLAAACVSMITLTSTMLTTFGETTTDRMFRIWMLGGLGAGVSIFIIGMAVYMIAQGTQKIHMLQQREVADEP